MNRSTKAALTRWLGEALSSTEAEDIDEIRACICRAFAEVEMARQEREARAAFSTSPVVDFAPAGGPAS